MCTGDQEDRVRVSVRMTTLSTSKAEELERRILEELADDYLGMWEVVGLVRDGLGSATGDASSVRESTMALLETMLMHGLVRPGLARGEGTFDPWDSGPGPALMEIERRWDELGREPVLGEIAWFDLTDYGEKVARR